MLRLDEARGLLLQGVGLGGTERLRVEQCGGRVLAEPVRAALDQPPAPLSAMDGYAVRSEDATEGAVLNVIGEAPAGHPFAGEVGQGQTVRIATGGIVPSGATRVIMQEHVERTGDSIRITDGAGPGFIREAGCDFTAGAQLLSPGELLTPARIALLAASGLGEVAVARRPRVLLLPSGDELRAPGSSLRPGEIIETASLALEGLIRAWGGEPVQHPVITDDAKGLATLRAANLSADVIVPLGGASVGERDLLRPAFASLGAELLFERIAVMPGKPSWHARMPDGRLVLGLPGNPASAFVCAHLLLKPLLYALTGRDPATATRLRKAVLAAPLAANGPREAYLRSQATIDEAGRLSVSAIDRQDSSLVSVLAAANALTRRLPGALEASAGETMDIMPIEAEGW
jgi:molybdopterin molybdotransferase